MDEREKLQERYDDAAFALMMDECAEADGEAFLAEFRAAAEAGELPRVPEDMDRLFRDTIRREYAGRERRVRFKQFKRAAARVAVAVFATIGILGTLVMSVEAWRVPIINYLIKMDSEYFTIEKHQSDNEILETVSDCMPDGYVAVSQEENGDSKSIAYQNDNGDFALFEALATAEGFQYDIEETECKSVFILGYEGVLVTKNGIRIVWPNGDGTGVYSVYATAIGESELLEIAERIAARLG